MVSRETSARAAAVAGCVESAATARDIGGLSAESESITVTRPPALLDLGCLDPTTPDGRFLSGRRPLRAPTSTARGWASITTESGIIAGQQFAGGACGR